VLAIVLVVASILADKAAAVLASGGVLLLAVFLLHAGGFGLGWVFARAFGYGETVRRTISIEVGMQNSGLGAALAKSNFASMPLTPTPCAISAVFHSVIGSVLAGIWRLWPPKS
jgi:BASS family bile acid:Na+ symporter